ncbi:hypothetical protein PIB30_037781 [Stylosanthes scabra]|uniref:Uncharacterized protein n=1 Tax=Stylosanthes scabra TaxID=79078 RepID=A0ABU6XBG1_9FABA|nr:hypothetical protein [Stylosanthes scabra]
MIFFEACRFGMARSRRRLCHWVHLHRWAVKVAIGVPSLRTVAKETEEVTEDNMVLDPPLLHLEIAAISPPCFRHRQLCYLHCSTENGPPSLKVFRCEAAVRGEDRALSTIERAVM